MIKLFKKRAPLSLSKVRVVVIALSIAANIGALSYLAYSNHQLQGEVNKLARATTDPIETYETTSPSSASSTDALVTTDDLSELENRTSALEYKLSLLGKTVSSCTVIPAAYSWFGAKPGYSDKLGVCVDSYTKLQNNL